ncbi:unnamed protein product [Phytomonas sp. EM1]|nr:unnamed protein product [Phytomonas sp. EM1]|eukprot:CCW61437.1 unnamed protein product [Phytomonas sp. isolate EM1]
MPLACFETYSNLQKDDDCFNARLQEINREIQDILVKTTQQREDYLGPSCVSPQLRQTIKSDLQGIAGPPADVPATTPSNLFYESLAAKQILQCTEDQLRALLEPLIEAKVHQMLKVLVGKLERTRDHQEETKASVVALSEEYQEQRRVLQTTLASFKHQASRFQQLQADFKDHEQCCHEQLTAINDTLSAFNGKTQLSEQRTARRLDELARHHHETIRNSLIDMENHVLQWKGELEGVVHRQVSDWRVWSDELEAHLARSQGVLSSVAEIVNKHTVDLRDLMETELEKRSEVRSCRRDVNRLEMLLRCGGSLLYTREDREIADVVNYRDNIQLIDRAKASEPSSMVLVQEISHTKEQVSYLGSRIEELERCLGELSQTHARGDGIVNRGGITRHEVTPQKRVQDEVLTSTRHQNSATANMSGQVPFHSYLSSTSTMRSPSERQPKLSNTITGNVKSRFCSPEQQPHWRATHLDKNSAFLFPLERSGSTRNSEHEKPVQRVVALEASMRNSRPGEQYVHNKIHPPQYSSVLPHEECASEVKVKEDLNTPLSANKREDSSSFLTSMHKSLSLQEDRLVTDDLRRAVGNDADVEETDSYRSRTESATHHQHLEEQMKGNEDVLLVRPDQYPPAPASDSESERNNYKLSRLAID